MSATVPEPVDRANANIARHLEVMARERPTGAALKIPRGRSRRGIKYLTLSFAELDAEVGAWTNRLTNAGVSRGDRTLVMVRQGLPLIASVFALFRMGAVPVIIDPGMGRKNFLACVERSHPKALVGIPFARLISRIFRHAFRTVSVRVAASGSLTARLSDSPANPATAAGPGTTKPGARPMCFSAGSDLAAILFTSGSTGAPKGVCYEHGMFDAQVRLIREAYEIEPGEVDLPLLPIFALFNPALGMTTVVPEIDPRRPATVDPRKIVQAIQQEQVTNSFGSPTLWNKIGDHCLAKNLALPSLRRVLCAGAPVPASLWTASHRFLPNGRLHSPYGATEALPVTTIAADEVDVSNVRGACVGRPLPEIDVKIATIIDAPIRNLVEASPLGVGEIGEIIVRGPVVTRAYDGLPPATAAAKIPHFEDGIGHGRPGLWHRMGDCGYADDHGRIWFCGRKTERVETIAGTLFTEPCEQVFRQHPRAGRCALIGLGERPNQRAAIVVETRIRNSAEGRTLARELRALALEHDHTGSIKVFYFHESFPVDVRHNAKIHRHELARWALTARGFESDPKR